MLLGDLELLTVSGGTYRIDGGTMFGIIPKALWSRVFPCDDDNDIFQATNCVLVRGDGRTVLIDTGYGAKLPEKMRRNLHTEEGDPLAASLAARGVLPEEIDTVILSHLHFDHAGGATALAADGSLTRAFPNAEYVVQRGEWDEATAGRIELKNAYPQENIVSLGEQGVLRLIEGDVEIVPGIRSLVTGAHTRWHQALVIESGGETAIYLADLCPTTRHMPTFWGMAYDVDPLRTRRFKPELLGRIADEDWLALFDHDPDHAAARLRRDDRREFVIAEGYAAL
ncbi:MAG: MBL fold metallo-hydrolase [Planctomycetaceae bacterium]